MVQLGLHATCTRTCNFLNDNIQIFHTPPGICSSLMEIRGDGDGTFAKGRLGGGDYEL